MSYKLLPPGTRHGNTDIYARISVPGKRIEVTTGTTNQRLAKRFAEQAERELYESHVLGGPQGTVTDAIDAYIAFKRPSKTDRAYLDKIKALIGKRKMASIAQADFDECCLVLYPGRKNATWNRSVFTPLTAALRHSGARPEKTRPKEGKRGYRSLTAKQMRLLIKNATSVKIRKKNDPDLQALLILLFYNGPRISEALNLTRERTDLERGIACFDLTKTGEDHWRPLHEKVVAALANLPDRGDGRWFRWRTRSGARKQIKKLLDLVGIEFTPHMARHTFGDLFIEKGGSVRDLMDAGGWKNERTAMRYTAKRVERVRKAVNRL